MGARIGIRAYLFLLILLLSGLAARQAYAQAVPDTSLNNIMRDTLRMRKPQSRDTAKLPLYGARRSGVDTMPALAQKKGPFQPNPKKAGLYSALLPGLGQAYNRQYWKIPLIYGAAGAAIYIFDKNYTAYQSYRRAYISRITSPIPNDQYATTYTLDQLKQLQDDYSKYVNLTVLFSSLGYLMQAVDAIVSAHLKNFDISRDISFHMRPVVMPNSVVGMGLVMNFR